MPNGCDEDYGPMLHLAPVGNSTYCLSYNYIDEKTTTIDALTATLGEWEGVFTQFLEDLRQGVRKKYHLQLDTILHRFCPIS